jgi:hypothetical protein
LKPKKGVVMQVSRNVESHGETIPLTAEQVSKTSQGHSVANITKKETGILAAVPAEHFLEEI